MSFKGIPLAYAAVGGLIAYSGIKGATLEDTFRAVLSGNLTLTNSEPLSNPNATVLGSTAVSGSASGTAIANDALKYVGHAYLYGGAPGANGANPWDCSSFVSWVLGHDMNLSIPGGSWSSVTNNGSSHGPTTTSYLSWSGATTIPANEVAAGDLCCWSTHIGVALTNSTMISALNPSITTEVTGIANGGPQGETVTYRRLLAVPYGLS